MADDDVRNVGGRIARLAVALVVAGVAGIATILLTEHSPHNRIGFGVYRYTEVVALFVSVGAFSVALVVANWLARKPRRVSVPRAWVVAR